MKSFLLLLSLLTLGVACSTPKEKYEKRQAQAEEEYNEELKEAEEEYGEEQKEEAVDYIEDSEGVDLKKEEKRIDVQE